MTEKVQINRLVNSILEQFEDTNTYYDRLTGEIVSVDDYYMSLALHDIEEVLTYSWQRDMVLKCKSIINNNEERFLLLPKKNVLKDNELMEEFIEKKLEKWEREELVFIINGSNRLKRFKLAIEGNEYEVLWNLYLYDKYKSIAINWCNSNGVKYTE